MNLGDLVSAVLKMPAGVIVNAEQRVCALCSGRDAAHCDLCVSSKLQFDIKEINGQKPAEA